MTLPGEPPPAASPLSPSLLFFFLLLLLLLLGEEEDGEEDAFGFLTIIIGSKSVFFLRVFGARAFQNKGEKEKGGSIIERKKKRRVFYALGSFSLSLSLFRSRGAEKRLPLSSSLSIAWC